MKHQLIVEEGFWVLDSSPCLPAVFKKLMLDLYDVLAFVSEQELNMNNMKQIQSNGRLDEKYCEKCFTDFFAKWFRGKLWATAKKRGLVIVLLVIYKWDGSMYDMMFYDDDADNLPN